MKVIKKNNKKGSEIIDETIKILKTGGLVIVPSDTVYGLAVDAANEQAVDKLINFKSRPAGKPISVFIASFADFKRYTNINKRQLNIIKNILPGAYTVVLSSKHKLSHQLESEKGTLGIRLIDHPFIQELTRKYERPITATSANLSGTSPHYSIDSLLKSLPIKKKAMIDLIVDYGKLPYNKPSTVIDLTQDEVAVLRYGDKKPKDAPWWRNQTAVYSFISNSEQQTKQIAQNFIKEWQKHLARKSLVIILKGELGVGKTQFVKGIGEYFGIRDIVSPTFTVYYEYRLNPPRDYSRGIIGGVQPSNKLGFLYHVDLYNITEKSEFEYLGFEKMIKPKNIICIEWGEKNGEIFDLFDKKTHLILINIEYDDINRRKIYLNVNSSPRNLL